MTDLRGGISDILRLLDEARRTPKVPCHSCGVPHTGLPAGDDCPTCESARVTERRVAEWRERQVARIPFGYREATLANYRCPPGDKSARDLCEEYKPRQGGEWLFLTSHATGTGKTHLAIALAMRWIASGRGAVFVGESELLTEIRSTFNAPRDDRAKYDPMREALETPLLVLDDLGTSNATPWASESLFLLLDGRMKAGLPTVLTSNFQIGALGERIGGEHGRRISSRLHSSCRVVPVKARDYRIPRT